MRRGRRTALPVLPLAGVKVRWRRWCVRGGEGPLEDAAQDAAEDVFKHARKDVAPLAAPRPPSSAKERCQVKGRGGQRRRRWM